MGDGKNDIDVDIELLHRKISEKALHAAASFRDSVLQPVKAKSSQIRTVQESLPKLKDEHRELENSLSSALSVKACKEVKHKETAGSLSTARVRVADLKKIVQGMNARKEKCTAAIPQLLHAVKLHDGKKDPDNIDKENLEEALFWYHKVLGFRTEGGEGVKFFFSKIDHKNPEREFSFTIRLEGDKYRLLQCDPVLRDTTDLIKELNETDRFFKFVRAMREKFAASALNAEDIYPDASIISVSSPPISEDSRGGSMMQEKIKDQGSSHRNVEHNSRRLLANSPLSKSATLHPPEFLMGS